MRQCKVCGSPTESAHGLCSMCYTNGTTANGNSRQSMDYLARKIAVESENERIYRSNLAYRRWDDKRRRRIPYVIAFVIIVSLILAFLVALGVGAFPSLNSGT